jgi:hypothetical protein
MSERLTAPARKFIAAGDTYRLKLITVLGRLHFPRGCGKIGALKRSGAIRRENTKATDIVRKE